MISNASNTFELSNFLTEYSVSKIKAVVLTQACGRGWLCNPADAPGSCILDSAISCNARPADSLCSWAVSPADSSGAVATGRRASRTIAGRWATGCNRIQLSILGVRLLSQSPRLRLKSQKHGTNIVRSSRSFRGGLRSSEMMLRPLNYRRFNLM